jgi:hypothetical protein
MFYKKYFYCFNEKKNAYNLIVKKKKKYIYFHIIRRKIFEEIKIFSSLSIKSRLYIKKAFKKKNYFTLINRPEFIFMYVDRVDYLNEDMYLDVYLHTFIDHHYLKHEIYTMDFVEENYSFPKRLSNPFNNHLKNWFKYYYKMKDIPTYNWIIEHSWTDEWLTNFIDSNIRFSIRRLQIKKIKKFKILKRLLMLRKKKLNV